MKRGGDGLGVKSPLSKRRGKAGERRSRLEIHRSALLYDARRHGWPDRASDSQPELDDG